MPDDLYEYVRPVIHLENTKATTYKIKLLN